MKKIIVNIPTYNEEDNVVQIANAVEEQLKKLHKYDYMIQFIDNDSQDSTREKIRKLCDDNCKIRAIFNAKNFGQFNSPYYGIMQCEGDCVINICADFQEPPELIPKFVELWEEGYLIVLGQKTSSQENRIVYRARRFYYNFMKKHSSVDFMEQVNGFGLYDHSFVQILKKLDDPQPFIRGIVAEMGTNIKLVPFEQMKRKAGKSSNGLYSYYDGAIQSITAYTKTGIRAAVFLGLGLTFLSLIAMIIGILFDVFNVYSYNVVENILAHAIFIVTSLQVLFIGIVGEYVLNINTNVRNRPIVIESERINFEK